MLCSIEAATCQVSVELDNRYYNLCWFFRRGWRIPLLAYQIMNLTCCRLLFINFNLGKTNILDLFPFSFLFFFPSCLGERLIAKLSSLTRLKLSKYSSKKYGNIRSTSRPFSHKLEIKIYTWGSKVIRFSIGIYRDLHRQTRWIRYLSPEMIVLFYPGG